MWRDYSAIPATSASSERVFSAAGNLVTKKRTRMASETIRQVLCCRAQGLFVEEDLDKEILIDDEGKVHYVQNPVIQESKVTYIHGLDGEQLDLQIRLLQKAQKVASLEIETPIIQLD